MWPNNPLVLKVTKLNDVKSKLTHCIESYLTVGEVRAIKFTFIPICYKYLLSNTVLLMR